MHSRQYPPVKRRTKIFWAIYLIIGIVTYGMAQRECSYLQDYQDECGVNSFFYSVAWPLWWSQALQK